MIIDETDGNYLIGSNRDHAVFRLSRTGDVTKFAELEANEKNITGMARNPETGKIVVTFNFAHSLIRISCDGQMVSRLVSDPSYLGYPTAILFERGDILRD